jgi:hypothetical protein
MCCFSQSVISVSGTNIFARHDGNGRQYIAYSMTVKAKEDLAMILPLPVIPRSGEQAVRFINLEDYPNFFTDMQSGFQTDDTTMSLSEGIEAERKTLAVVEVGSFEASYVPTVRDFGRLDPRFCLPEGTWESLPQYKDYGFAVFKLKQGAKTIHPMAFDFPSAVPSRLFFPTVHIHDGQVHATAKFDHALFCQRAPGDRFSLGLWHESAWLARAFMKVQKCQDVLLPDAHCYKMTLRGQRRNTDIWLG